MVLSAIVELIVVIVKVLALIVLAPFKWLLPKARKDVSKEVILITGGGMGMGRLMAMDFARLGATVVIWDVNKSAMDEVVEEIEKSERGGRVFSYVVDVSKPVQVSDAAEKVRRDAGDVTILINNAGLVNPPNLLSVPDNRIQLLMDVNTTAHLWTLRAFLPAMIAKNHGHVATVASSAGIFGVKGMLDYCASKFGAVGLHESMTLELSAMGKDGVKTTLICPYLVKTGMFEGAGTKKFKWLLSELSPEYAVGRMVDGIRTNSKFILMPRVLYAFFVLKPLLPADSLYLLAEYFQVTQIMDNFVGHAGKKTE